MLLAATSSAAGHGEGAKRAGTIAFVHGGRGDSHGLYVIHADGGGLHRVTPPGTHVVEYAWSPNRRLIAYIDRRRSLWLIHPDGSGRRFLLGRSKLSSMALSWSPDGKEIAIVSAGANPRNLRCTAVYVVPVDGGSPVRLASTGGCDIAWSPRGDEIAYDANGGTEAIHSNGTGRHRLTAQRGAPGWSADGSLMAFVDTDSCWGGCRWNIEVVDAHGDQRHLFKRDASDRGVDGCPDLVWSPKGRRILYCRTGGIYVVGANGRNDHRVTPLPSDELLTRPTPIQLAWSPDGHSIVYVSNGGGLYEVGVNGRGKVQLTNPHDGVLAPSWVAH